MPRRVATLLAAVPIAVLALLGPSGPAAATPADKPAVLSGWTQTVVTSYNSWNSGRQNQGAWAAYEFNWSTDYCSSSPDNPLGFDFTLSCYRHDFGYRNYKAAGQFTANKDRLDNAFYEDLKRKCNTYNAAVRPACVALAWTYYQAVRAFGSIAVSSADVDRAARLLPSRSRT
jgi:hypothetical protein